MYYGGRRRGQFYDPDVLVRLDDRGRILWRHALAGDGYAVLAGDRVAWCGTLEGHPQARIELDLATGAQLGRAEVEPGVICELAAVSGEFTTFRELVVAAGFEDYERKEIAVREPWVVVAHHPRDGGGCLGVIDLETGAATPCSAE